MTPALTPEAMTVGIAVLAELHPTSRRPDRVHGVIAWTDRGDRHYQPLVPTVNLAGRDLPRLTSDQPDPHAGGGEQLRFDLGGPGAPTSSGRTWRTWALPSVPTDLRHAPLGEVTRALAEQLGRCA